MWLRSIFLGLVVLLTGCVSSEVRHLAQDGDWQAAGFYDGQKGHKQKSADTLAHLSQGMAVDQAAYDAGYAAVCLSFANLKMPTDWVC